MLDLEKIRDAVMDEYKKIAFAPLGNDLKVTDKIKALDAYWTLASGQMYTPDDDSGIRIRVEYV